MRSITHIRDSQTGLCSLILTKEEELKREADWEVAWQNVRCPGLTPEQSSFIFEMAHGLLPNNSRLYRFGLLLLPGKRH